MICTVATLRDPSGPCGSSGLLIYGTHEGSPRFIPCGLLIYGTHEGSPRFIPCGLLVYGTHVGSPRCIPCGLLVYGTHVGSPRFIPFRLLVHGIHVGCPGGSHLGSWVAYGARLAHVGPSRHLHCGTQLAPMLVKVVLTYFWYLWTLELVVTYCYIKCIYTRPFANLSSAILKLASKWQFEIKVSNALINLQIV